MRLGFILKLASSNLRDRKLRTTLTVGGMIIGIGLIIFLVSLGYGLQRLIKLQITEAEALTVLDVTTGSSVLMKLDQKAIEPIYDVEGVLEVSPSMNLSARISKDDILTDVAVYAIDTHFTDLEDIKVTRGKNFSEDSSQETVVSNTTVELLGYTNIDDVVGKKVEYQFTVPALDPETGENTGETMIEKVPITVVGVVDDELAISYLSLDVAKKYHNDAYNLVKVKVDAQENIPRIRGSISSLGFQVDSIVDTIGQIDKIFFVFQVIVAGLGFVAMFVASLGTFNTLTVSLLERTREIGIMKSLGAKRGEIYKLFMSESLLIGFFGTLLGIFFGYAIGEVANICVNVLASRYGGEKVDIFSTPVSLIVAIFIIVFGISLFTGLYPARRASRINPLDAIRYE